MPSSSPPGQKFRFGVFEYDPQNEELRKRGVRIRLKPQSARLLGTLLEKPGQVITRAELCTRLWPSDTFVDFEHRLHDAISRLRYALGDSAEAPRYIETLSRRGYRFIGELQHSAEISPSELVSPTKNGFNPPADTAEVIQPPTQGNAPPPNRSRVWLSIGLFALLILACVMFLRRRQPPMPALYSAVPFATYAGLELCPSFATDGERVAFSWNGEKQDNFDIYVKQIRSETPVRLTSDPRPDLSPTWSPDGRTIAFVRISPNNTAEVLTMPSLGGNPERRIAELKPLVHTVAGGESFRCLAWSPDGKWLVMSDARSTQDSFGLFLLSVETGEKRPLTIPPIGYDDLDPAFSPDMTHLAFVRHSGPSVGDLYLLELNRELQTQGEPQRLTSDHNLIDSPVWTRDGQTILFTRFNMMSGRHRLWKIALSKPRQIEPVPVPADNASGLALSPKGDRLIYIRDTMNTNIWAAELSTANSPNREKAVPHPFISSSTQAANPAFSPDGKQIAFQTRRSGWVEIWVADQDGSHPRQLTNLKGTVAGFPAWSPDGKKIIFHLRRLSTATLFVVDVGTGRARPLRYEAVDDFSPSWSHDGKWIYFASRRTGDYQVWKVGAEGGSAIRITDKGGSLPSESPDGAFLFFAKLDNQLWRMPLPGGDEQRVFAEPMDGLGGYAVTRRGIYFAQADRRTLSFWSFETRRSTKIIETPRPVNMGLAVSPDERLLLYSQRDQNTSDLMLVENFH